MVSEVEFSESYCPDCSVENAGILMVPQDHNPSRTHSPGPTHVDPVDSSDLVSQTSNENSRNNNANELLHRLRLNAESSCQTCTMNQTPPEVQKMGYRHPPPYPEQMEQNISSPLDKYRHPPPYREPEDSIDSSSFYGQGGTFGNDYSAYYNLEENYRQPPSYRHTSDRFSLDSRMANGVFKQTTPKKAMSESLILNSNGYNYAQHASNGVSDFHDSKGVYSAYGAKPFSTAQDSFSYVSYGDAYTSEAGSRSFGFYADQGTSTKSLFSKSRAGDMLSYGDSPSPPVSSGSRSGYIGSQAQSLARPNGSLAMQQSFGEKYFPAVNMAERKNLGT